MRLFCIFVTVCLIFTITISNIIGVIGWSFRFFLLTLLLYNYKRYSALHYIPVLIIQIPDKFSAKAAGITVMNESGLDPGIDHMLAMECIDMIHEYGGKVSDCLQMAYKKLSVLHFNF